MNLKDFCYRFITEKISYNNNLGFGVSLDMSLNDVINNTIDYVDKYHSGNSFHASLCLMKILDHVGIKSEMLFRIGKVRIGRRLENSLVVAVLLKNKDKMYVMNPIEDIEFFTKESIEKEQRKKFYEGGSTSINTVKFNNKKDIWSMDAGKIEIEDYINRYGEGRVWNVGSLFREDADKITLGDIIRDAKIIKNSKNNVVKIKK